MAPGGIEKLPSGARVIYDEDLQKLLDNAAEAGATIALKRIGLSDEDALVDVKELRNWISAWRSARQVAGKTLVSMVVKGLIICVILGVCVRFGIKPPGW